MNNFEPSVEKRLDIRNRLIIEAYEIQVSFWDQRPEDLSRFDRQQLDLADEICEGLTAPERPYASIDLGVLYNGYNAERYPSQREAYEKLQDGLLEQKKIVADWLDKARELATNRVEAKLDSKVAETLVADLIALEKETGHIIEVATTELGRPTLSSFETPVLAVTSQDSDIGPSL